MTKTPQTKIWADTVRQDMCDSARCGKTIWFAMNVRTGNFSPFDTRPEPVLEERELETNRVKWTIDLTKTVSHFATCPARQQFRRPR